MRKSTKFVQSTEKLIESDASTEDYVVVPPLDLSKCRQSNGSLFSESSPIPTHDNNKHHVVVIDPVDIHQTDDHHVTPPIPAARGSLLNVRPRAKAASSICVEHEMNETGVKRTKRIVKSQAPEIKPRIKKKLFGGSEQDETTSFIEFEKKDKVGEIDKHERQLSDSEGTHCTDVSNNDNQSNDSDGSNELAAIASSASNEGEEKEGTSDDMSIVLHKTSSLRFNAAIRSPNVRISIYDLTTGRLLQKRTGTNDVAPILSQCSQINYSNELIWTTEPIRLDVDIRTVYDGNTVIFFEIIDRKNRNSSSGGEWFPICWAFLRPCDASRTFSNIGTKCCLQLYEYQRFTGKMTIFDQWKMKRKTYPGYITVTLNDHNRRESPVETIVSIESDNSNIGKTDCDEKTLPFVAMDSINNTMTRLDGQQCLYPSSIMYRYTSTSFASSEQHGGGSMIGKFNPSGTLYAFHCQSHEICVLNLENMKIPLKLNGHRGIVYDLDWFDDMTLVSVSSDCSAIVWFLQKKIYSMTVLPHSSFVYALRCLNLNIATFDEYLCIATGGRDCTLRIWCLHRSKLSNDSDGGSAVELCDEFDDHQNYITSLATSPKATKLYSADWNGVIFEWRTRQTAKYNLNSMYKMKRKLKSFPFSVSRIELDARGHRLYAQGVNDSFVHSIEITSGIVIQTIGTPNVSTIIGRQTFAVSPCSSSLFKTCTDLKIVCWNLTQSKAIAFKLPIFGHRSFISSISYHPSRFVCACTIYGDRTGTCVLLMNCEHMERSPEPVAINMETIDDYEDEMNEMLELPAMKKSLTTAKVFGAFGNILNHIDDLFALAISSSNRTDDYKQRHQLETSKTVDQSDDSNHTFTVERTSKVDIENDDERTFSIKNSDDYES